MNSGISLGGGTSKAYSRNTLSLENGSGWERQRPSGGALTGVEEEEHLGVDGLRWGSIQREGRLLVRIGEEGSGFIAVEGRWRARGATAIPPRHGKLPAMGRGSARGARADLGCSTPVG